jgi:hypothetical protein
MRNRVKHMHADPRELTHRSDFTLPDAKRFELGASLLKRFVRRRSCEQRTRGLVTVRTEALSA